MKIGILLLNMGGPAKLEDVRPFLFNLFSDREIIELGPRFLQRPIAWIISRTRAPKSMENYRLIGGKSPLTEITISQAKALERLLNERIGRDGAVEFVSSVGMRYWHPRTPQTLKELKERGVEKVIGLSLYPHFSRATGGTSLNEFEKSARDMHLEFISIKRYPTHPAYINALKDVLEEGIDNMGGGPFHLVYSAHSLPKRFILEGDPYLEDIKATIKALEARTGIKGTLAFQSRSGPVKWLEPQTDKHLLELIHQGKRRILCLPISFVSDHIETLYEIDMLFKGIVKEAGGELYMTPGLNTRPAFIEALFQLTREALSSTGWIK